MDVVLNTFTALEEEPMLNQLVAIASAPSFRSPEPWAKHRNLTVALPLSELARHLPQPQTLPALTVIVDNRPRRRPIPPVLLRERKSRETTPVVQAPEPVQEPDPQVVMYQDALTLNGWDPKNPPKLKAGYYADPKELYYRTVRCIMCGGVDAAGNDGMRFVEIVTLMAQGFLGRISFRDPGELSNVADDLVQEAITKCCFALKSFDIYDKRMKSRSCNNAFGYFTTVIRNKMYETLRSPLKPNSVYLEDLCTDNQSISDLF